MEALENPPEVELNRWYYSDPVTVTREMVNTYIELSQDTNPIHADVEDALIEHYGTPTIPGFMTTVLLDRYFPIVNNWVIGSIEIKMREPIFVGDTIYSKWRPIRLGNKVRKFDLEVYVGEKLKQKQTFNIINISDVKVPA